MMGSVAFTFAGATSASGRAGFDHDANRRPVGFDLAADNPSSSEAGVRAVLAKTNAADQTFNVLLSQARIGANHRRRCTAETFIDTGRKCRNVHRALTRMRSNHVTRVMHGSEPSFVWLLVYRKQGITGRHRPLVLTPLRLSAAGKQLNLAKLVRRIMRTVRFCGFGGLSGLGAVHAPFGVQLIIRGSARGSAETGSG